MRQYYPCIKSQLEDILNKHNYLNNNNIWDVIIHKNFCIHKNITGKNKNQICLNKKIDSEGYCKRHSKKETTKCNGRTLKGDECKRNIKVKTKYCKYCIKKKSNIYKCNYNIFDISLLDHVISNKQEKADPLKNKIVKKFNFKLYIIQKINEIKTYILNFISNYKISVNIFICIFELYIKISKKEEKMQFHSKKYINIEKLKNIKCISIIKYLKYKYNYEGDRIRIKDNNFNIVITNESYIDNITLNKGVGSISLYMYLMNKSFKESIEDLDNIKEKLYYLQDKKIKYELNNKVKKKLKNHENNNPIPEKCEHNIKFVKDYLINTRYINEDIINNLLKNNLLSSDSRRNCIFYNENRTYAFIRSTNNKRFVKSTGIPNFIIYKTFNNKDKEIYLFESVIDTLSYMDLTNIKEGFYVSINGSSMINRVVDFIKNIDINKVYLCFDNDKAGDIFSEKLKNCLLNYNCKRLKPCNKDWNDDLQERKRK